MKTLVDAKDIEKQRKTTTKSNTQKRTKLGYIAGTNLPARTGHKYESSEFAILERRKTVASRYLHGTAQWEIAKQLNVNQSVVSDDLDYIRKEWLEKVVESFDMRKAMEVARIDWIENRMTEAFEKSCLEDSVTKTKEKTSGVFGDTFKETVARKRTPGNTKYIEKIQWCIEMRCKIFGIIKDEKRESINTNIINIQWDSINSDTGADNVEEIIRQLENMPTKEKELVELKPVEEETT